MKVMYKYPLLAGEGEQRKKKRMMLCKQKGRMCILKYNNHSKEIKMQEHTQSQLCLEKNNAEQL